MTAALNSKILRKRKHYTNRQLCWLAPYIEPASILFVKTIDIPYLAFDILPAKRQTKCTYCIVLYNLTIIGKMTRISKGKMLWKHTFGLNN